MDHQCQSCHPERYAIPFYKRGPFHIGKRFDDELWNDATKAIYLDGVNVSDRCVEAELSEAGWALLYCDHRENNDHAAHLCSCGDGTCVEQKRGRVELRDKAADAVAEYKAKLDQEVEAFERQIDAEAERLAVIGVDLAKGEDETAVTVMAPAEDEPASAATPDGPRAEAQESAAVTGVRPAVP
ncbi:MAG TPA: hypothetical protein VGK74_02670 [Symbiobacteriaceae bacterium]|jgi:hypothetical protein